MFSKRRVEAFRKVEDRWRLEDAAPRLRNAVPRLVSLSIVIDEIPSDAEKEPVTYIRRVSVTNAPALFLLPCCDRKCAGGGHDLTDVIIAALQSGKQRFGGRHPCEGVLAEGPCGREMRYVVVATYR